MKREEFIGKLEMVYVGDRNAFNEIVEDNQKLKNEVVYSKVEIDRLNKEYERIYNENCKLRENHNINDITLLDENERLNNIINHIDNFVDRTIEVIKQQPSDNDEWILERLNGIKYLTELKENNK